MKPPPRTRNKPDRNLKYEPPSRRKSSQWQLVEQRNLLKALKSLSRTTSGKGDIDYELLRKNVPARSISEIQAVVEYLKDKVISLANSKLQRKRQEEKKTRKPIQMWTQMASALAGTLEGPISAAFCQMLIVSSTEPRTLRNCDPPQVYRPPADEDRPVGRTVPLRPMPRLPVKVEAPGANTARPLAVLKTPAPAMGPAKRLQAPSQVIRVPNRTMPSPEQQLSTTAGTSPAAAAISTSQSASTSCQPGASEKLVVPSSQAVTPVTGQVAPSSVSATMLETESVSCSPNQTTQQPSEQHPTALFTTSTSKSTSSSPHTPLSSPATCQTPVPSTAPSSDASSAHPTTPLSTSAAACHTRFGRTSKYATEDSPRMFGVKSVVDFERIYRYLSFIHQPNEKCHLTPMESAIVLDLLMSLPEELRLLDCNKLHKHLIQVYQFLSSTADSKTAGEMFKDLKDGLCAQMKAPSGQHSNRRNGEQSAAATADGSNVTDSGGKKLQSDESESQSSGSNDTSCHPPLNPFMVPLKLLMRK